MSDFIKINVYVKGKKEPITYSNGEAVEYIQNELNKKYTELKDFASKAWNGLSPFDKTALATAPIPVIGDIAGLVADADMFINDPESRTLLNAGLSAAGLIPFVPALSTARKISKTNDTPVDDLPMDQKSRMGRAKEQGYYTGMPVYHGTNKDFDEFNLFEGEDPSRSVSRSPVGKLGVSLALDPKLANEFASRAGGEGMNVIPALHRAKNPVSIDLDGGETNNEIFATVTDAWKQGYDSIKFNNYTTDQGGSGQSFVLVKDPNQVRSVNASFDESKKLSPNLLAGAAGATVMGSAFIADNEDSE